jgi:tRNA A-37 threonylcarbamoyl transferase component Bud32
MEQMAKERMRKRFREAELHRQMRQAGIVREGWVRPRLRWLVAYLRCLPAIMAQRWERHKLLPVAAHDATPKAACCD